MRLRTNFRRSMEKYPVKFPYSHLNFPNLPPTTLARLQCEVCVSVFFFFKYFSDDKSIACKRMGSGSPNAMKLTIYSVTFYCYFFFPIGSLQGEISVDKVKLRSDVFGTSRLRPANNISSHRKNQLPRNSRDFVDK